MAVVTDGTTLTYGSAITALGAAQKPGHGVPAYTRYVNRSWGRRLAAVSYLAGMTPNQVTVISGLVSGVGIVALAVLEPGPLSAGLVTLSLLLGYALDSADGQLARLRGGGSATGEWLDHVIDAARIPAMHIAVAIAAYRFGDDLPEWFLLVPLGYLLVSVVRFFANMLTEQLLAARVRAEHRTDPVGRANADPASRRSLARSLVLLPTDTGTLSVAFVLLLSLPVFAVAYGILFVMNAAWLALTLTRRYRAMSVPTPVGVGR